MEERRKFAESKGEAWEAALGIISESISGLEEITSLAIRYEFLHAGKIRKASAIRKLLNQPDKPAVFDF